MKAKYPRTPHLPWSNAIDEKDIILPNLSIFEGKTVLVNEKLDGENITITKRECYLQYRSLDAVYDKQLLIQVKEIQKMIADDYILHGEYLLIKHGIYYEHIPSYLMIYFVEYNGMILNWDKTYKLLTDLNICTVNVLYHGIFNRNYLYDLSKQCDMNQLTEGYVIHIDCDFKLTDIKNYAAKYVRRGFQQIRIIDIANQLINSLTSESEKYSND